MRPGEFIEGIACDKCNAGFAEAGAAGAGRTMWASRAVRRVGVLACFQRMAELGHGVVNLADRVRAGAPVSIGGAVFQNGCLLHYSFNLTVGPHG